MLSTIREQTLRQNLGRVVQEGIGKAHWTSSSRSAQRVECGDTRGGGIFMQV
jgi:hypothetical protein